MPNIAPAAAPAKTLANTFPEPIVVNFKFKKIVYTNIYIKYTANKN
jgi:hypothetical protein